VNHCLDVEIVEVLAMLVEVRVATDAQLLSVIAPLDEAETGLNGVELAANPSLCQQREHPVVIVPIVAARALMDVKTIKHQRKPLRAKLPLYILEEQYIVLLVQMTFLHVVTNNAIFANASNNTSVDSESIEVIRLDILTRVAVRNVSLLHDEDCFIQMIQRKILLLNLQKIPAKKLPLLEALLLKMQIVILRR
jgi:hypothetical protein